ncbi:polysaccharide biosynthesis tyrosine autokinase [Microbacterium sp. KRD172]|uniref:polysaccharide biosynthesis tyrosine autokinase n=1 Tax=Microbacterium sp. KRD172 TaxID=2729727 RepID=UPI0019CF8456|nr:polysaccharide biosynthesis tyrosine autokinase [Microbacterium sp. KRD172]
MIAQDYVRLLRRNLVLILSLTLIGLSIGVLVALTTPTRYTTSTRLLVSAQAGDTATPAELNLARGYAQQAVTSYVDIIPSSLVLQPVIDDLGLDYKVAQLSSKVSAAAASTTSTAITLTVSDRNPAQAARLANAIGDSFTNVVAEQLERPIDARPSLVRIDTLEAASVPVSPSAPNVQLTVAIGALLGLAAGIAFGVLRSVLDNRVRTLDDVERAVSAPMLGGIALDPQAKKRPLVVSADARDPRAEAFRSLRTNVKFLDLGEGSMALTVTSAGPGEGKSTTTANLAITFADSGARVALIDADLRLPRIADYFSIEGGVGLTEVLIGRATASETLQHWGRGALFILPAGTIPPNPAELLGSSAMTALLNDLKAAFDIILIDSPPVGLVTDAAVLARQTQGAILVTASGKTRAGRLSDAEATIEKSGAKVLGTVVTMLPTRGADRTAYGVYGG